MTYSGIINEHKRKQREKQPNYITSQVKCEDKMLSKTERKVQTRMSTETQYPMFTVAYGFSATLKSQLLVVL